MSQQAIIQHEAEQTVSPLDALSEMRELLTEACEAESAFGGIIRLNHILGEPCDTVEKIRVVEGTKRFLQIVERMRAVSELL